MRVAGFDFTLVFGFVIFLGSAGEVEALQPIFRGGDGSVHGSANRRGGAYS
tara:strand:- start:20049 stop:20201 length:153 start_codon:yes stop_codon:yes gene_type:complete